MGEIMVFQKQIFTKVQRGSELSGVRIMSQQTWSISKLKVMRAEDRHKIRRGQVKCFCFGYT